MFPEQVELTQSLRCAMSDLLAITNPLGLLVLAAMNSYRAAQMYDYFLTATTNRRG